MTDGVEFLLKGDTLFARWNDGREERVGKTYQEIAAWWRSLLAKAVGSPVGSPQYNAFVDKVFGGSL